MTRPEPSAPIEGRDSLRIVVPRYGAEVLGGAEGAMRQLAQALSSRNWRVQVYTTTALDDATWAGSFRAGAERDGAVEVSRFPVVGVRRGWPFRTLSRAVYHLPRPLRPEHLWAISQGPYTPSLVRALVGAEPMPTLFSPYLYYPTLYGLPAAPHPRILCPAAHDEPALRLSVVARAVSCADALWFHSAEERDVLLREHAGSRGRPSECGVVGVDPPGEVDPSAFARRHHLGGPYLYFGGRGASGKGVQQLVAAVGMLRAARPDACLVLSGGPAATAGLPWVRHVGRLDARERWEAIAGAVAVVVPGVLESLSLLALEAWAMGRPCLVNAASPVLAGHAARGGGACTFRNAAELAAGAAALFDDPAMAAAVGQAGRAYVLATYRWDLSEQRLRRLIRGTQR